MSLRLDDLDARAWEDAGRGYPHKAVADGADLVRVDRPLAIPLAAGENVFLVLRGTGDCRLAGRLVSLASGVSLAVAGLAPPVFRPRGDGPLVLLHLFRTERAPREQPGSPADAGPAPPEPAPHAWRGFRSWLSRLFGGGAA
ncbi:MAG: hypothetical protein IRZ11_07720 [Clostridia bacterium]|nr:hypothetical protein [Clostridia bacterium]